MQLSLPLKLETKEGWIEINPLIKKINAPEESPDETNNVHLDMTQGDIYTIEELNSWIMYL